MDKDLSKSVFLNCEGNHSTDGFYGYKVVKNGKDTATVELNDPRPALSYKQMKKIIERNR